MGPTYVDTNVFITAFESEINIAAPARALFLAAEARTGQLVTSELTIAEVLAPSSTPGGLPLLRKLEIYRTILILSGIVQVTPVTRDLLLKTAELRSTHRYKLADAIHVVTAQSVGCSHFCSADRDLQRLPPSLLPVLPDRSGVTALLKIWNQ